MESMIFYGVGSLWALLSKGILYHFDQFGRPWSLPTPDLILSDLKSHGGRIDRNEYFRLKKEVS